MTETEFFLSGMLWLCVGFLVGYRYHVLKVRDAIRSRIDRIIRDRALDNLIADVAVTSCQKLVAFNGCSFDERVN